MISAIVELLMGALAVAGAVLASRPVARLLLAVFYLVGASCAGPWGAWGLMLAAMSTGFIGLAPLHWILSLVASVLQLLLAVVLLLEAVRLLRAEAPKLRWLQIALGVGAMAAGIAQITFALV